MISRYPPLLPLSWPRKPFFVKRAPQISIEVTGDDLRRRTTQFGIGDLFALRPLAEPLIGESSRSPILCST